MIRSVLIIDDDEAFQFYMKILLQKYPEIETLTAYDGQQALDLIDGLAMPPELIFLDLNMPVMNGHEFLETWTTKYDASSTRVVIISSSDTNRDKESVGEYNCVKDYVIKPALADKIDSHIMAE